MKESRTRLFALLGTIAAHAVVVGWLAASPERTSQVLEVLDLEFVELPDPPEPELEPVEEPPRSEPEAEAEPEPEPRPQKRVERRPLDDPLPVDAPEQNEPDSDDPPGEGGEDLAPGERVIDFGEQSFALPGFGTGFGMGQSNGGSRLGAYRPGSRGGGGGGNGGIGNGGSNGRGRPFSPVPQSMLSKRAELVGNLARSYPDEARRQDIEGAVRLMVEIRANGTVRNVRALNDPGGGLADSARSELRRAQFRPALDRSGRPVATRILYTVRYVLDA